MIDHALAFLRREREEELYRSYLAETVRLAGEDIARLTGGQYLAKSWSELISPEMPDERSGDEIAADVIRKAGLKLKGDSDG